LTHIWVTIEAIAFTTSLAESRAFFIIAWTTVLTIFYIKFLFYYSIVTRAGYCFGMNFTRLVSSTIIKCFW
jgi:hypothetical protein